LKNTNKNIIYKVKDKNNNTFLLSNNIFNLFIKLLNELFMSNDNTDNKSTTSFQDLQSQLDKAKNNRDELNQKTKDYINTLQEIESNINELVNVTKEKYRKRRDSWNQKVAKLKDKKIEYKDLLTRLITERNELQKDKNKHRGKFSSIKKIDSKIENLERIIETENLEISEENMYIDQIQDMMERKNELIGQEDSDDYFKIEKQIKIVKINLNKIYEQLNKWSNKSQDYHIKMLEIYDEVKEYKDKKKKIEEDLIENKKNADKYHEEYLKLVKEGKKFHHSKFNKPRRPNYKSHKSDNKKLEKIKRDKLATALEKQKAGKKLNIYEARLIFDKSKGS